MKLRVIAISVLLFLAYIGVVFSGATVAVVSPGTLDFMEYWSAWHLMSSGQNPYDSGLMYATQVELGASEGLPVMMWNPPWTAVLLAPILQMPFGQAALLWFVSQLFLLCGLVALSLHSAPGGRAPLSLCGAVAVCFLPVMDSLMWGQTGLLIAFGVAVFASLERRSHLALAGAGLAILSVKPHLFILAPVPGLLWFAQISREGRRSLCFGGGLFLLFLLCLTLIIEPRSIEWWFEALQRTPQHPGVVSRESWQTALPLQLGSVSL